MENNFSTIKGRVSHFLELQGIAKGAFYESIGMTPANFRGDAKERPLNSNAVANILSSFPDMNPDWLLTGEGEMLRSSRSDSGSAEENVAWYRNKIDQKDNKIEELDQMLKEQRAMIRELEQEIAELKDKLDECEEELLRANAAHIESGAAAHVG